MASSMSATIDSLEAALQSNHKLQEEVTRQLQGLASRKGENRRLASRLTTHILAAWDQLDDLQTPPLPPKPQAPPPDENTLNENILLEKAKKRKFTSRWKFDPYRRWTRRFFVDPDGTIPTPNEDTLKRRRLEQGKFFYHSSPPWSNREIITLRLIVTEVLGQSPTSPSAPTGPSALDSLDFHQVARLLEEHRNANGQSKSPNVFPRSAKECQLKYLDSLKPPPITKEASMRILEHVCKQNGTPSWQDIDSTRTAWQCLVAYQTKLSNSQPSSWTPAEDELLLKYAAAMGPQWVLNLGSASYLSSRLMPERAPKQILARANASLVNPNYIHDTWSDEEERRLVLCMKIYRDAPSALIRATAHFPNRSSKSVSDKWHRSLNPEFSNRPFSAEEDQALLDAVDTSTEAGWAELARTFRDRHPRNLYSRWMEIASPEDVLKKYRSGLKMQEGARRGVMANDGLLSSDDFTLRMKSYQTKFN